MSKIIQERYEELLCEARLMNVGVTKEDGLVYEAAKEIYDVLVNFDDGDDNIITEADATAGDISPDMLPAIWKAASEVTAGKEPKKSAGAEVAQAIADPNSPIGGEPSKSKMGEKTKAAAKGLLSLLGKGGAAIAGVGEKGLALAGKGAAKVASKGAEQIVKQAAKTDKGRQAIQLTATIKKWADKGKKEPDQKWSEQKFKGIKDTLRKSLEGSKGGKGTLALVDRYGKEVEKYPKLAGVATAILAGIAGAAGSGVLPAVLLGVGVRVGLSMLQGKDLGSSIKSGLIGGAAGAAGELFSSMGDAVDVNVDTQGPNGEIRTVEVKADTSTMEPEEAKALFVEYPDTESYKQAMAEETWRERISGGKDDGAVHYDTQTIQRIKDNMEVTGSIEEGKIQTHFRGTFVMDHYLSPDQEPEFENLVKQHGGMPRGIFAEEVQEWLNQNAPTEEGSGYTSNFELERQAEIKAAGTSDELKQAIQSGEADATRIGKYFKAGDNSEEITKALGDITDPAEIKTGVADYLQKEYGWKPGGEQDDELLNSLVRFVQQDHKMANELANW